MDEEASTNRLRARRFSSAKTLRTVWLAALLQTYWPKRLSREEIIYYLSPYYGDNPVPALYRDLATLTGCLVEELPSPDEAGLSEWYTEQRRRGLLSITYDRSASTFGLEESLFSIDISGDEARAFVALQEGFSPGTPYAEAVQYLLRRWEWLLTEGSRQLIGRKRRRRAPLLHLPLSPVVDYSQHGKVILELDQAIEEGAYVSFAYAPLSQSWSNEPVWHEHIEPFELEYRDGHWYFTAYIFDLNTFLDYRVDRIKVGTLLKHNDHFLPGSRQRPGVMIRYWVSPMLARHGSMSIRLREQRVALLEHDQGAIVEGYAKSIWWAKRLLLGYGEQVKALAPEKLVTAMQNACAAMSKLYEEEKE